MALAISSAFAIKRMDGRHVPISSPACGGVLGGDNASVAFRGRIFLRMASFAMPKIFSAERGDQPRPRAHKGNMKSPETPAGEFNIGKGTALADLRAASVEGSRESRPMQGVAAVATGSGSVEKRRWREYPAAQFSEADLPVWGYYPDRTHSVRLIDFMGNQMTHWMPARDDIPEAPTVRQPTPNRKAQPDGCSTNHEKH